MANPAGESNDEALRLDFDRRLRLQFRGSVVTSDAGLLAYRELDDALGLSAMASERLADARTGKNGHHALVGMLRQAVFGRLAGYEDVNDAGRLRHDPAIRWIVGGKAASGVAASASHRKSLIQECRQKAWGALCHAEWISKNLDDLLALYQKFQAEDTALAESIKESETAIDYHTVENRNKRKAMQERRNKLAQKRSAKISGAASNHSHRFIRASKPICRLPPMRKAGVGRRWRMPLL